MKSLQDAGVDVVICSTCLDYFDLAGKTRIGRVGGMPDILAALQTAEKVISL